MFTKAITKKPCRALIDGITTSMFGEGTPDYDAAIRQHDQYVATLRELGLEVTGECDVKTIEKIMTATSILKKQLEEAS